MGEKIKLETKYQAAVENLRYQGEIFWQVFGAFLLPHTVFLAFLLKTVSEMEQMVGYNIGLFVAALMGLLLSIPWGLMALRRGKYYFFCLAKTRELEPSGLNVLAGDLERFGAGLEVVIQGKTYKIGKIATLLRAKHAMGLLVISFFSIYSAILIASGPWL